MAEKSIKIHLVTAANLAAIRAVNSELASMAMQVGRKNGDMRQATMLAAREYYNLGDAADKAASRAVLSARQIEEAWRKAMSRPAEDAEKSFGRFGTVANSVLNGVGGKIASVFREFTRGGIWGLAAKAVSLAWEECMKVIESRQKKAYDKMKRASEKYATSLKDALSASVESMREQNAQIDRGISRFDAMTASVKDLTKAEIELAKQRAIANGMDPASANAAAADLSAQVDDEAEERRLQKTISLQRQKVEQNRKNEAEILANVEEAARRKSAAEEEYQRKREEYIRKNAKTTRLALGGMGGGFSVVSLSDGEISKNRARAAEDFENSEEAQTLRKDLKIDELAANMEKGKKEAAAVKVSIANAEDVIARYNDALDALATRRAAREQATQNEIAAKAEETVRKREEAESAAAEKRAEDERKAAEKVAAERARLDAQEAARRERERQKELADRIRDHQKLLAAERAEESKTRSAVSAAESKLQRAWGWYRNKDSMAAQLQEEKADAEARKQYEKDFDRLKSKRRDWRTAENLSVDEEATRRVALAREEKEAAEKHLAEIEKNTADLAAKLDELLSVKG